MTAVVYPREFAGDTNFASGTDNGTPTKVDPGSAAEAQGIIAGLPFAAAHMNFTLNGMCKVSRWAVEQALQTMFTPLPRDFAFLPERTFEGAGAVVVDAIGRTILIKGGGTWIDNEGVLLPHAVVPASCTQPLAAAGPRSTGALWCVGSTIPGGGGDAASSTDFGSTWVPRGSALGANAQQTVIFDANANLFILSGGVAGEVYSANDSVMTARALSAAHQCKGLAVLSSGLALALRDNSGVPEFDSATNAVTWSATGGAPTGAADFGAIASNGSLFFWAGLNGSNQIAVWASANGAAWSQISTVAAPTGTIELSASCKLICERGSGVLWMAVQADNIWYLYASVDSGVSWIGPRRLGGGTANAPSLHAVSGYLYVGITGQPFLRTLTRLS